MDKNEIRKWHNIFKSPDELFEIRILGKFQYSGYFKSLDVMLESIKPYCEMDDEQVYFTLNEINDACYGRQQCDKIIKSPKATTADSDITRRRWLLIDFDPKRSTGVNSSDDELELAHKKAQSVFLYLRKSGFPEPVICISGNGWHLLFKVDLPNDNETTEIIKSFLQALSIMFSDDDVEIDEKVFNAGRICKLYGTTAKKGANLSDRPWRESRIVYVPKVISEVTIGQIKSVADLLPKEQPQQNVRNFGGGYGEKFDLESFLNQHNIGYKKVGAPDGTKYILDHCFFNESHKGKDAVIFQYNSGAVNYICLHNSCKGHTWREMRLALDPHAYDYENQPKQYRQILSQHQQISSRKKQKYEIKNELPELGEKWLSMSKIKKIDLTNIEHVKTGFTELDRNIVGLNMSEMTILSGNNASGKSSWLNTLILNIVHNGVKVALWSGELRPDILKAWIQMVAAGKSNLRLSQYGDGKYYVPQMIGEKIDMWLDGKLFIYNNEYGAKWEQIFHDMNVLLTAGVKVFVLDNLFSLDIDLFDGDKNNKQKELVLQIKEFAKKNMIHIILVAHPRKSMSFLRKNDISGSADIQNAADNIFIIHRCNQDFFKGGEEFFGKMTIQAYQGYGNVLEVAKNRMYGVVDTLIGFHYEVESRRFKNTADEQVHYGWEEIPEQQQVTFEQPKVVYDMPKNNIDYYIDEDADRPF